MKCPSCKTKTQVELIKTEFYYPDLFLGMPTFWRFMTPVIARNITAIITFICIGLGIFTLYWINKGHWVLGISASIICLFSVYIVIACFKSMSQYRVKNHYKCLSCRLEWSWFQDE
jgi:hypothetical protein